jgi:hypothetical protein
MLDVTGAEIRIPAKPSDVFLKAIQALAIADPEMPETEFKEYAEAWRQICHLEELSAAAERKIRWENLLAEVGLTSAPTAPGPVACEEEDTSSGAAAPPSPPGEGLTYDCASAPMTDEAEAAWAAAEAEAKAREAANRSAGAKAGFATRKRNLTERLEELRRRGVKMHEIAAAVNGLTITDVMDALEAKPMSPMKVQALETACKKLEEADAGGGEDS